MAEFPGFGEPPMWATVSSLIWMTQALFLAVVQVNPVDQVPVVSSYILDWRRPEKHTNFHCSDSMCGMNSFCSFLDFKKIQAYTFIWDLYFYLVP